MRTIEMLVLGASLLRVCGRSAPPPPAHAAAPPVLVAEHGGVVAVSGGLSTEVVAAPDGRLVTYLHDAQRAPVQAHRVDLVVQHPAGHPAPVAVAYDPAMHAYVGRPVGLVPGRYPVEVTVQATAAMQPVRLVTPPLAITAVTRVPAPRYGGRVEIVGDHAVETVVARSGDVGMFWMDLDGRPIPPAQVQVPTVTLTAGGRVYTAPTRVVNAGLVAHFPVAPPPDVVVAVPGAVVAGHPVPHLAVTGVVVAPALPPVLVVAPPPPMVVRRRARTIVVGHPAPAVVVVPPTPYVVVGGHVPHAHHVYVGGHGGWGHGHRGRGHGGWHGGHGHGGGRGRGRGRGRH